MKILFLYHPYCNEGMSAAFGAVAETVFCSTKGEQEMLPGSRRMGWREFWSLRRRIRAREFDLIIAYACDEALWRANRAWPKNLLHAAKKLLFYFPAFALRFLLPSIKASGTRLAIYDYDDRTIIPRMRWPYLEACTRYFKLHPAINPHKSFFFQTKRDEVLWNIIKNERYTGWIEKIRPVSYGVTPPENFEELFAPEKKYDVFFSGGVRYSPVRRDGLAILEQLRAEGLRVCLPERLPRREFLRACAESWLVLSPEGAEWDSARHYEALLMKSVPVINYPTVRRHAPLIDGEHAIFYPPEDGLLKDVIRRALADKDRLRRIAEAGHEHVLRHHLHPEIVAYVVRETMAAPGRNSL